MVNITSRFGRIRTSKAISLSDQVTVLSRAINCDSYQYRDFGCNVGQVLIGVT